jgi:hypothetical protein
VNHAAWLYNQIPQRFSGITPLEMVTNFKSDHRDLMRTHVWGCPAYVLEAKLQDGKKLPKWNWRAWMGQFLGFSKKHFHNCSGWQPSHGLCLSPISCGV